MTYKDVQRSNYAYFNSSANHNADGLQEHCGSSKSRVGVLASPWVLRVSHMNISTEL